MAGWAFEQSVSAAKGGVRAPCLDRGPALVGLGFVVRQLQGDDHRVGCGHPSGERERSTVPAKRVDERSEVAPRLWSAWLGCHDPTISPRSNHGSSE